jgi:hypothetical protein
VDELGPKDCANREVRAHEPPGFTVFSLGSEIIAYVPTADDAPF